jgi:hypothetical protein
MLKLGLQQERKTRFTCSMSVIYFTNFIFLTEALLRKILKFHCFTTQENKLLRTIYREFYIEIPPWQFIC